MVIQLQPHLYFYWERITHLCMIQRVLPFTPPLLNVCGSSASVTFVPAKWENLPSGLHVPAEIGRQTDGYARFMPALKSSVTSQRQKNPDAGKDWGQEEKEATEDEMVGWHHWLNRHEFQELVKDREAWQIAVHGIAKSWTWLSDWTTATTAADSDQIFCPQSVCPQTCRDLSVSQITKWNVFFSPPCYFLKFQPVAIF